jgi:GT2 family glycosyltransferase
MMSDISAGITFFNGDLSQVEITLARFENRVRRVFVFANSNLVEVSALASKFRYVDVLGTGHNIGVSRALNALIHAARDANSDYVVLLDQDTSVDDEYFSHLLSSRQVLKNDDKVAAVFPILKSPVDFKKNRIFVSYQARINNIEYIGVTFAPISAGLYSVDLLGKIPFSEELFVDLIDVYWGLTVTRAGHKLLISKQIEVLHTIGYGTLGRGWFKIPKQSDMRYIDYLRGAKLIVKDNEISFKWRLLIILQSIKIIVVRLLCCRSRYVFAKNALTVLGKNKLPKVNNAF